MEIVPLRGGEIHSGDIQSRLLPFVSSFIRSSCFACLGLEEVVVLVVVVVVGGVGSGNGLGGVRGWVFGVVRFVRGFSVGERCGCWSRCT